jgi:hypothetical protein
VSWYLGAYWGPRREAAEQCARRLRRCLDAIAPHGRLIGQWYHERDAVRTPSPRPENWTPVPLGEPELAELLARGINRGAGTEKPMLELGFQTGFWNLKDDEEGGAGISAHCGSWSEHAPPNNFLLDLPAPEFAPELYQPHTARALMETVVECWQPDWATWTSRALRRAQRRGDAPPAKPLGWATYFSAPSELPSDLPPGSTSERLGTGWLITIGGDPGEVPVELLLAVRDALGEKVVG